jgi:lysophospholipase L1-like esterase
MTEPGYADPSSPNGLGEHGNVRLSRYVAICREVAREADTPLVDNFAVWTRHNADGDDLSGWVTDGLHPNPHGHQIIAETMLPVIVEALHKKQ